MIEVCGSSTVPGYTSRGVQEQLLATKAKRAGDGQPARDAGHRPGATATRARGGDLKFRIGDLRKPHGAKTPTMAPSLRPRGSIDNGQEPQSRRTPGATTDPVPSAGRGVGEGSALPPGKNKTGARRAPPHAITHRKNRSPRVHAPSLGSFQSGLSLYPNSNRFRSFPRPPHSLACTYGISQSKHWDSPDCRTSIANLPFIPAASRRHGESDRARR